MVLTSHICKNRTEKKVYCGNIIKKVQRYIKNINYQKLLTHHKVVYLHIIKLISKPATTYKFNEG